MGETGTVLIERRKGSLDKGEKRTKEGGKDGLPVNGGGGGWSPRYWRW